MASMDSRSKVGKVDLRSLVVIAECGIVALGVIVILILSASIRRLSRDLVVVPAELRGELRSHLKRSIWSVIWASVVVDVAVIVMAVLGPDLISGEVYGVTFVVLLAILVVGAFNCIETIAEIVHVFRQYDPDSKEYIQGATDTSKP